MENQQQDYQSRKDQFLYSILEPPSLQPQQWKAKHMFLVRWKYLNEINEKYFRNLLSTIKNHDHKADFDLIILIRFLFLSNTMNSEDQLAYHRLIDDILSKFAFWPNIDDPRCEKITRQCFWSENHIFMYLSSAILFYERAQENNLPCFVTEREIHLLKIYLEAHVSFGGLYETLSPVYLPYTLASLLNLYDFSKDSVIRSFASYLINIIIDNLLLCCNCQGISTFTPSTRQFNKTQTRAWGHNVNQMVYLLTGKAPDERKPTPIVDFLLTSSWSPSESSLQKFHQSGEFRMTMSHTTEEIREIYSRFQYPDVTSFDLIPFYWSAGLVTHPNFIEETKLFQSKNHLNNSPGIGLLGYIPQSLSKNLMESYDHYSAGQNYTGVILNGYKSSNGKIVLASFEMYNVGLQSYQQVSWMGNIAGLPIWTQSGGGSTSNAFAPAVKQQGPVLVCASVVPSSMRSITSSIFDRTTYFYWPSPYFEREFIFREHSITRKRQWVEITSQNQPRGVDQPNQTQESKLGGKYLSVFLQKKKSCSPLTWRIGVISDCYVCVCCTEQSSVDESHNKNAILQLNKDEPPVVCPRLTCSVKSHSWICVVGDLSSFQNIEQVMSYCEEMRIESTPPTNDQQLYSVQVEVNEKLNEMIQIQVPLNSNNLIHNDNVNDGGNN